ncbi:hypothetical protein GYMLUDRAFT_37030 [Collybiopsis luxurians FD-317 M1]|nr:hypothetical protein GYMLUDRAFT_37030 [Collybiopsis luxurians FD-317 M1]
MSAANIAQLPPHPHFSIVSHPPSVSSIRRKPKFTYLSPTSSEARSPVHLLTTSSTASPSSTPSFSAYPKLVSNPPLSAPKSFSTSNRRSMGPPLPLYHPFGKLAMSVPSLDPAILGINLPVNVDDDISRTSSHSKRSGVKLRDAAVETDPIPPVASVSAVAAIAAREIKDKASPRKKRAGGGRKRNRTDDGDDATYPAKKARQPRGAANGAIDEDQDSLEASTNSVHGVDGTAVPAEWPDKPDRRTTRSRGAISRRDSTASESPSVSAVSAKAGKDASLEIPREIAPADKKEKSRSTSKEEGEVSEESKFA